MLISWIPWKMIGKKIPLSNTTNGSPSFCSSLFHFTSLLHMLLAVSALFDIYPLIPSRRHSIEGRASLFHRAIYITLLLCCSFSFFILFLLSLHFRKEKTILCCLYWQILILIPLLLLLSFIHNFLRALFFARCFILLQLVYFSSKYLQLMENFRIILML